MIQIALSLKDIYSGRKSGSLVVEHRGVKKILFFQEGGLIFVKTEIPEERLGAVLFAQGKIDQATLEAIPSMDTSGRMLGESLIADRRISKKDLYEALLAQMSLVTLSLFASFEDKIDFQERERFREGDFETKLHLPSLIERGIREMPFHPTLAEFLGPKIPVVRGGGSLDALDERERALLSTLKGDRTSAVVLESQTLDPRAFWKAIYLFYCLELIDFRPLEAETTPFEPESTLSAKAVVPATPDPPPSADLQATLDEALELHRRLPELDYYQLLGVGRSAGEEEIKKAYFKLARKFHPDHFGRHIPSSIAGQIDAVFDAVTKAYRTLTSRDQKMAYASKLSSVVPSEDGDASKNAETRFRQGKTLFNQGRYEEAVVLIEEAVRLKDDKGDYFLLLAMAQTKVPSLSKKAERNFVRAIEIEPWNPEGFIGLGYLYKQVGLLLRARKQFEKALEIDADHAAARQAIEEIDGKSNNKKGRKGFFNKDLFGSKKK
jgi:curved DNA-binding protein CbpA